MSEKIVTINKAKQLYQLLKNDIIVGKYPPKEKIPSIREFSKIYGLSCNTVSTVLQILSNEGLVQVMEGLGTFVVSKSHCEQCIGVMLFDFSTPMHVEADVLKGIQNALKKGYFVTLVDTANSFEVFLSGISRLKAMGIVGIIAIAPKFVEYDDIKVSTLKNALGNIPLVFANRNVPGISADFITADLYKGTSDALEYFSIGHKKKIGITLHDTEKYCKEQLSALHRKAKKLGLEIDGINIIEYTKDKALLRERFEKVVQRVDGLIAFDHYYRDFSDVILNCSKKIPDELSLVSIYDTYLIKQFPFALTAIDFPASKVGKVSVETLISRIEGIGTPEKIYKNIPTNFIIRST